MSNYPNMSYCMCENTVMALQQVVNSMQEEGLAFLLEMSRDERRAFQELFYSCESFINQAEELEDQLKDIKQGFEQDKA